MNINPGELNKKIQIYTKSATTDADGYATNTETLFRTCWAKFTRTSGAELIKSNADFSDVNVRFLIRYASGITRKMVVKYGGEEYEIVYVNDYDDGHQYIELWAEKVGVAG